MHTGKSRQRTLGRGLPDAARGRRVHKVRQLRPGQALGQVLQDDAREHQRVGGLRRAARPLVHPVQQLQGVLQQLLQVLRCAVVPDCARAQRASGAAGAEAGLAAALGTGRSARGGSGECGQALAGTHSTAQHLATSTGHAACLLGTVKGQSDCRGRQVAAL